MLGQAALRQAVERTRSYYPAGINFLRSPTVYTARKSVSDPAAVGAEEIATDSTYTTDPTKMVDGDMSAVMWNGEDQTMQVWVRTPGPTNLSEVRMAYYQPGTYPGASVSLHAWQDGAWTAVATLTYGGDGALVSNSFATVTASLFRITLIPGASGWVGVTEVELYP